MNYRQNAGALYLNESIEDPGMIAIRPARSQGHRCRPPGLYWNPSVLQLCVELLV